MAFRALHQTRNSLEDGGVPMMTKKRRLNTTRILDREGRRLHKYNPLTNTLFELKCLNVQIGHHKCMTPITAYLARALSYSARHAGSVLREHKSTRERRYGNYFRTPFVYISNLEIHPI